MSLQPITIIGYDQNGGLQTNKKPLLIPDKAYQTLENAYIYRERTTKREGLELLGRLERVFSGYTLGPSQASPWTFNLLTVSGYVKTANNANPGQITTTYPHGLTTGDTVAVSSILGATGYNGKLFTITVVDATNFTVGTDATGFGVYVSGGVWISNRSLSATEPNSELEPGTVVIILGAITFTDQGNGTLTSPTGGNSGTINYVTGTVILTHTAGVGAATTLAFDYFPALPVMGITIRELAAINDEQTIWFDTKYAYIINSTISATSFQEFIPGTTWAGTDSDFFWTTNYRGINPQDRLFFVTNFVNDSLDPIRYTDGNTWTNFTPAVDGTNFLIQARILIPYFGRLLALNVWEGANAASAVNIFNRCRFSAIGNPIATNAWRSDQFGQGGFLDAPTNEAITSAVFLNNTLIVFFERTTWQLRYVGEYGLPFIWERIASDLGCESTFSPVLFNQGIFAIGDKAIVVATSQSVERIDLNIPDTVFDFQNANSGVKRVQGIRDYKRELVFWCYADSQDEEDATGDSVVYPNKVLIYNYRNNTWAKFRDNVTAFGTLQLDNNITWDSQTVTWDDNDITWDDDDQQSRFPFIVSGNQQGFCHKYGYVSPDQASLSVTGISVSSSIITLTVPNHNLEYGDIIYLNGMQFVDSSTLQPVTTDLNGKLYRIAAVTANTITLFKWDFVAQGYYNNIPFTPPIATSTYVGGGQITLFPKLNVQTKDFNPFQNKGMQMKLSYIDFLLDVPNLIDSVAITAATKANPCVITSAAHGLANGQKVTISGIQGMTQLNVGQFYTVTVVDANNFSIGINSTNFGTYTAGGAWTFLTANMSVQLFMNSSPSVYGNLVVGNNAVQSLGIMPFYSPTSKYQWHRFYASCAGQYMNIQMTFDDNLMNTLQTHKNDWELNGINIFVRPGGKIVF